MRSLLLASTLLLGACAARGDTVDLLLVNGRIYTGDPSNPFVETLAIDGGKIVDGGTPRKTLDLGGRFACPGLVDSHAHMASLGRARRSLDLVGTSSYEEILAMVREKVAHTPEGEWITGRGWDQNDWDVKEFPSRETLDAITPDHPVWLVRIDGHAGLANRAALEAAGITSETEAPEGGRILLEMGILVDNAMDLLQAAIPARTPDQIREDILAAQDACLAVGLTGVHDAGIDEETIRIYRGLDEEGLLKIRIHGMAYGDLDALKRIFRNGPVIPDDGRFTLRAIKLLADGALGSRGAALLEDYADDPGNRGLITCSPETIAAVLEFALPHGLQVCTHAIGDRANRLTLDAYEAALAGWEGPSPRLRIEHAQVLHPGDIPRFGKLGIIAAVQPTHYTSDIPWAPDRLGPERIRGAYAWRSLLESGTRIAGGSDFPVESENPLQGIRSAITREDGQELTLQEAIQIFTAGAHFASFQEDAMHADIVVLQKDPFSVPPEAIPTISVWATIIGGKIEYNRD